MNDLLLSPTLLLVLSNHLPASLLSPELTLLGCLRPARSDTAFLFVLSFDVDGEVPEVTPKFDDILVGAREWL
jgi:hypothetical protein